MKGALRRTRRKALSRTRTLAAVLLVASGVSACGGTDADAPYTITVFAAASLTAPFTQIAELYEAENSSHTVQLNFAGSSDLVAQVQQGADADVFASADEANMEKLLADDLVDGDPEAFAANTLTIAVPPGNPAGIETLTDLTGGGVKLVVCASEVPCGAAAARVEEAAGLDFTPVSEEQSVTDVLGKVRAGEADAGLVYVTDVAGAGGEVEGIDFSESAAAVNTYPIAVLADADKDVAEAFMAYVLGEAGQEILAEAGFAEP